MSLPRGLPIRPMYVKLGTAAAVTLRLITFEYNEPSAVRTSTLRLPGLAIISAVTVVATCWALMMRVVIARPSMTILTPATNLSPVTCKLKSPVRAKTLAGERFETFSGGVGAGVGVGVGFTAGGGGT